MSRKVVVVGLDGMTFKLINPFVDRGKLPNIKKLMQMGSYGKLESTIPSHTAPAWSSFATGKNPGKHGVFEWLKPLDSYNKTKIADSSDVDSKTFYELLDEEYKCCLINLPLSHPPRISGTLITSFVTKGKDFVFPETLKSEIDFSTYQLSPVLDSLNKIFNVEENLMRFMHSRMNVIRSLYQKDYNFFFFLFSETDTLQHCRFNVIMNNKIRKRVEKAEQLLTEIDQHVGWFMHHTEQDTTFIVMSDHGFKTYDHVFYINEWLKKNNYLHSSRKRNIKLVWGGNRLTSLMDRFPILRIMARFIYIVSEPILPFPSNIKVRLESHLGEDIDLTKTIAFCPSSELGCVYINDKRFEGVVNDSEYENLREELISKFNKLPYIDVALKKENVYWGSNIDKAPDIILKMNNYKIERSLLGRVTLRRDVNNHDQDGILIMRGPSVRENYEFFGAEILDLAPTILYLMNCPIPSDMDGKVLEDAFYDDFLKTHPVRYVSEAKEKKRRDAAYSEDEEKIVRDRLRGLGYLT